MPPNNSLRYFASLNMTSPFDARAPGESLSRPLEQCRLARPLKSQCVRARAGDGAHLLGRRTPVAAQDRLRDLPDRSGTALRARKRIHRYLCVRASDTRLAQRLVVPLVCAVFGELLHIDQFERAVQNVEVSLVRKFLRRIVGIHGLSLTHRM